VPIDDNGNRTSFGYDALDRKTSHTFADGKKYEFTYDLDSNVKTVTDPNGSVITKTFDALNRLVQLDVARGAGVVGTTRETYSYDGVSRLVRSTDDNGAVAATQVWEGAYDSLGRMLEERQNGRAVSSRYTGDGKRASVTYAGGRTITRGFDVLDRITQLSDVGGPLATSDWIGSGMRELRRQNRNGTQLTFLNDAGNQDLGFDAVQRITRLRVLGAGGPASPIVDREYGYNRASQRTFEKRNDDHGLTDRYTYDSSYRIVASSFDQDGLPGAVARDLSAVGYRYDGVGNRRDVSKTTTSVGVLAESYGVNALNQYTSIAAGATPAVVRDHDDNGNLTDDGSKLLTFDYKNRLVGAQRKSDSAPVALYSYLADGRRVRKQVWNPDGGALVRDTRFVLDGAQEVEEQDWSSGATTTTYVWSPVYVDELVEFTNASGSYFAHQDARCDVVAVTNAAGAVVERRRFDDFGRVEVRDAGGAVVAASPSGLDYGFQGRRLDPETGLVFFRARYYAPDTGRFVQRDPVWDAGNVGGQYTFCGNGPIGCVDPMGTGFWSTLGAIGSGIVDTVTEPLKVIADAAILSYDVATGSSHDLYSQTSDYVGRELAGGRSVHDVRADVAVGAVVGVGRGLAAYATVGGSELAYGTGKVLYNALATDKSAEQIGYEFGGSLGIAGTALALQAQVSPAVRFVTPRAPANTPTLGQVLARNSLPSLSRLLQKEPAVPAGLRAAGANPPTTAAGSCERIARWGIGDDEGNPGALPGARYGRLSDDPGTAEMPAHQWPRFNAGKPNELNYDPSLRTNLQAENVGWGNLPPRGQYWFGPRAHADFRGQIDPAPFTNSGKALQAGRDFNIRIAPLVVGGAEQPR